MNKKKKNKSIKQMYMNNIYEYCFKRYFFLILKKKKILNALIIHGFFIISFHFFWTRK